MEEALRRYNISYTMVGGFSFYERAEIKDLMAYLRLVRNPHDSMALQRAINTPARGIGKTSVETLERVALESGKSTWDAIAAAIQNKLIPTRALSALDSFRQLILDAQAMMDPDFAGKLAADVAESESEEAHTGFNFGASTPDAAASDLDASFGFGGNPDSQQMALLDPSHFSPFAAATRRPFLKMPKQADAEASKKKSEPLSPLRSAGPAPPEPDFESGPEEVAQSDLKEQAPFRSPGDAATLP